MKPERLTQTYFKSCGVKASSRFVTLLLCIWVALFTIGCASNIGQIGQDQSEELDRAASALLLTPAVSPRWQAFVLPGKRTEPFVPTTALGQPALRVRANSSVSILRQRFVHGLPSVGRLTFSWKVDALPPNADLRDPQADDAPVRIVLTFGGDRSIFNQRTRRLSELSLLLTGEELPFATLAYVWSADESLETVVNNPRTDRIRKVVVETGEHSLGQWRRYERDVQSDFMRAFGEEPGPLLAVALMTDTDNTSSQLQAWYGPLLLEPGHPSSP
jgi:hypothetical protein